MWYEMSHEADNSILWIVMQGRVHFDEALKDLNFKQRRLLQGRTSMVLLC